MRGVLVRSIPQASMLNPIQLLVSMADDNAVAYCPLVYAYLPYQLGQTPPMCSSSLTHIRPGKWATRKRARRRGDGRYSVVFKPRWSARFYGDGLRRRHPTSPSTLRKEHTVCSAKCGADSAMAGTTRGFYFDARRTIESTSVRPN